MRQRLTKDQKNYLAYRKRCVKAHITPVAYAVWLHQQWKPVDAEAIIKGFREAKRLAGFD